MTGDFWFLLLKCRFFLVLSKLLFSERFFWFYSPHWINHHINLHFLNSKPPWVHILSCIDTWIGIPTFDFGSVALCSLSFLSCLFTYLSNLVIENNLIIVSYKLEHNGKGEVVKSEYIWPLHTQQGHRSG